MNVLRFVYLDVQETSMENGVAAEMNAGLHARPRPCMDRNAMPDWNYLQRERLHIYLEEWTIFCNFLCRQVFGFQY
jgi:hypothetical protein